jgi:hypothetical protein
MLADDSHPMKVDECFCCDEYGTIYFCVGAFLRLNKLPDDPRLRLVVIEELLDVFPEVQILDERE